MKEVWPVRLKIRNGTGIKSCRRDLFADVTELRSAFAMRREIEIYCLAKSQARYSSVSMEFPSEKLILLRCRSSNWPRRVPSIILRAIALFSLSLTRLPNFEKSTGWLVSGFLVQKSSNFVLIACKDQLNLQLFDRVAGLRLTYSDGT